MARLTTSCSSFLLYRDVGVFAEVFDGVVKSKWIVSQVARTYTCPA